MLGCVWALNVPHSSVSQFDRHSLLNLLSFHVMSFRSVSQFDDPSAVEEVIVFRADSRLAALAGIRGSGAAGSCSDALSLSVDGPLRTASGAATSRPRTAQAAFSGHAGSSFAEASEQRAFPGWVSARARPPAGAPSPHHQLHHQPSPSASSLPAAAAASQQSPLAAKRAPASSAALALAASASAAAAAAAATPAARPPAAAAPEAEPHEFTRPARPAAEPAAKPLAFAPYRSVVNTIPVQTPRPQSACAAGRAPAQPLHPAMEEQAVAPQLRPRSGMPPPATVAKLLAASFAAARAAPAATIPPAVLAAVPAAAAEAAAELTRSDAVGAGAYHQQTRQVKGPLSHAQVRFVCYRINALSSGFEPALCSASSLRSLVFFQPRVDSRTHLQTMYHSCALPLSTSPRQWNSSGSQRARLLPIHPHRPLRPRRETSPPPPQRPQRPPPWPRRSRVPTGTLCAASSLRGQAGREARERGAWEGLVVVRGGPLWGAPPHTERCEGPQEGGSTTLLLRTLPLLPAERPNQNLLSSVISSSKACSRSGCLQPQRRVLRVTRAWTGPRVGVVVKAGFGEGGRRARP